jgi:putative tryptophan/tyrosine transport system substrate-binding protein
MKMSIRDNIDWCQRQIDNAKDTLGGNKRGSRYFVNGEETSSKKAKATAAIIAAALNTGLVQRVVRVSKVFAERKSIIALAASHRLPAVYPLPIFAADGGLVAYGPNVVDQFRQAAPYVDRILKGEKPADLPAQTKYELAINLKTAKALDLAVPPLLLATADEVIE